MKEGERLNRTIRQELERIVAKSWPVDGPFISTLDELASEVRAEFGMPSDFLNLLMLCIGSGIKEMIKRKDDSELLRLAVRMYLSGTLQGARWRQGLA